MLRPNLTPPDDQRQPAPARRPSTRRPIAGALSLITVLAVSMYGARVLSQQPGGPGDGSPPKGKMKKGGIPKKDFGESELERPYKGITTNGSIIPDLFPIRSTGVTTAPVVAAAGKFLDSLTPEQRAKATFPVDDIEWRKWMNVHFYVRQGVGFGEMSQAQRAAAFGLLQASLSVKGLKTSRDIMKLNQTLAELTGDYEGYGEDLYWITVMGTPSATEPWGWQVDGHHLVINYFVLGDQVAMTPAFMGSEPVKATSGKYAGTEILQAEQDKGLALMNALDEPLREKATISASKGRNDNKSEAFKDNIVLDYAGARVSEFSAAQKELLMGVVGEFVGNMDDGHAKVRMDEVRARLDETYFAWIGESGPDGVFYYRVQSPVILIEFDHQAPIALGRSGPTRQHIHTVVRTPNGNDYGKDLLRQHYLNHPHPSPSPAAR